MKIDNIMKIDKTSIILFIIVILSAFSIFQGNKIRTDVKDYNKKIEVLQKGIDSIIIVNETLTEEINNIDNQITKIDGDVTKVQKNIIKIKNITDEKIDNVDNYNFSDLNKFFTDRYKTRYDSTTQNTNSKTSN